MTLFETLAIQHGNILNLHYHNQRFRQGQVFLNRQNVIDDIAKLITIPKDIDAKKLMRCRVTYDKDDVKVAYFEYMPKNIRSFKLVECNQIAYAYKYDDRNVLNHLLSKKGECDEVIIIKNGFVTDCSIGNLIFLKDGIWYTPDTPLLQGTQRAYLLDNKKIQLATMKKEDIWHYQKVMMINALNGFDETRAIMINQQNIP